MSTLRQSRDVFNRSVEHLGGLCLWQKVLLFSTSMSWRGWDTLFRMLTDTASSSPPVTASRESSSPSPPVTEPAFLTSLLSRHRLVEHLQHPVADAEASEPPEESSGLICPALEMSVCCELCCHPNTVEVNGLEFVLLSVFS